jgi:N-acetylglucosaminyl-diphospho-decaprenol L-rhamnosyltransferase
MPSLAVIIVNFNTRELLRECLRSLSDSETALPFHIFVVDNRSTDGSAEMVLNAYPHVTLIKSDRNGGFGYANNLALRHLSNLSQLPDTAGRTLTEHGATSGKQPQREIPQLGSAGLRFPCDYILFLNPDTVLPSNALQATVDFLEEHPNAAVVGPRMVKPDGSLDLACRRSFPTPASGFFKLTGMSRLFPNNRFVARYNLTYLPEDLTAEVDSVMGAYMLLRSAALAEAGLFDEEFFMYGEDLDLAFRLKERGWKVYYYPDVEVLHHKGASSRKQSQRSIREFYRAMHVFHRKHYSHQYNGLTNAIIRFGISARGTLALFQNALRPAERKRVT